MPRLTEELTDRVMRDLPVPPKGNVLHYDPTLKGFAGRVTAAGGRAFVLVYHFGGAERRDTVGEFPAWKTKAARAVAENWRRDLRLRIDPRGEPEPEPEPELFKTMADQFLAHARTKRGRALRPATVKEYRHTLLTYAAELHDKPVRSIRRGDVAHLIAKVATERGTTSAMHCKAALSRFFGWLVASDQVDANPVTGTEGYTVERRKRVLTNAELRAVWGATIEPTAFNLIVRAILWTGTRRGEPGGMADSELGAVDDFEGLVWKISGARTKNHRDLWLPLPRQARGALEAWPRSKGRDKLFGRVRRDKIDTGFQAWSQSKARLDERIALANAEQRLGRPLGKNEKPTAADALLEWDLHDLRRTVETRLAMIRVRKDIANRILNHAQGPITETYDHHDYLPEKAAALQAWADELARIVTPAPAGNVVRFAAHA